ncbi:uncharacterized protein A4U43_C07F37660 [Asparagus officinalis]|uniref:Uncharacterized protein n=1 Tax=Asparagus officinalis TaxID=4686 RepID=A0A5P1EHX4_ASPOF|nr:uncharacterized protein A4U43_C07F37660 [Asparagus officinalis]
MAASLKLSPSSSPPLLLNPKSRSSPHLLKPFPSPPLSSPRFSSLKRSNLFDRRGLGLLVHAVKNDGGMDPRSPAPEYQSGGESTMPERFRYLTREAPDRPVRWPWVIALFFLVYCWRTVLWELSNWKKAALAILHFFGYLSKLALAFVFHFIGDPITGFIRIIESSLYLVRDIYFSIIAFAPVPELTRIILFASTILAIGEATVPDSVNSQPYLLTLAGIIGFGAVKGVILEPFFWLFLVGIFYWVWGR